VALAKQAGCRVGTTTNATLLNEATITRIVASGMDVLAFSLAGIGETNDAWRQGTSYLQVLNALRALKACKRRLGKDKPRVHVAYMLLRSGLPDLAKIPGALHGLGIDQVVISTLDLVASPELEKESLAMVSETEGLEINTRLEAVAAAGARHDLVVHFPHRPPPGRRKDCPENVLRAAVLSTEGNVSPCVYTNIPASVGDYYVRGRPHYLQHLFFGNLLELSLLNIWHSPAYRSFRRSWQRGALDMSCRFCLKIPSQ